ncbi:energy transducer TonB [Photobacterium aquimaris]|uniref:Gram-negative bacterial tonB protein n=1 Tax=Photobacterium aquimaris TaxID=512643 RepID=A0A1Y6KX47_9GAMM|nr:energy transducer TonB [Photobacterium aquimaris]SMY15735.1 Gram-negative bacterial tonB protein [Photobacterium aquimaris]
MNTKRYIAAGAVSLLVHSMFLAAMPTKEPLTLTMGTDTPRVSLTFTAAPPAKSNNTPTATPVAPTVNKIVKKPIKSKIKRLSNTDTVTQKIVKKKPPIAKTNKLLPEKPQKKTAVVKNKKVKKTPQKIKNTPNTKKNKQNNKKTIKNQLNNKSQKKINNSGTQVLKLVSKPTFATRPSPVNYPKLAKRRGIEGQVLIEVWIGAQGQQLKQKLIKSSGAQILDNAAIAAIKKWRFSSHIVNGKAIAHRVQIPVRFKLD